MLSASITRLTLLYACRQRDEGNGGRRERETLQLLSLKKGEKSEKMKERKNIEKRGVRGKGRER